MNADRGSVIGGLAQRVVSLCQLEGEFTLRSGQISSIYFDKYLFEAEPDVLREVVAQMVTLVPEGTEVLAGLELGGVPVATALSLETGLPTAFVRKQAKQYGTAKLAEGTGVEGRSVLVVEDVITTGPHVATSTNQLRELGAAIDAVVCVIDRSGGDHALLDTVGVKVISLFRTEDLA